MRRGRRPGEEEVCEAGRSLLGPPAPVAGSATDGPTANAGTNAGTNVYVTNRLAGTISVIDLVTRAVRATLPVGGSPDMIQVSADGRQLWTSNRYGGSVSVVDTTLGR